MTKKELEEIRHKLMLNHSDIYSKPNSDAFHFTYHWGVGFDTCAEILLPVIKDYEEALQEYADIKMGVRAREVLEKHRGNE